MQLLNDIHHLAFITADMNRLIAFYDRVFDARVTLDLEEEGLRHAPIEVGPHTVLHPFEGVGLEAPAGAQLPSVAAFEEFYDGPTYRGLKSIRDACSSVRLVSVAGLA